MLKAKLGKYKLIHVITDLDVGGAETMLKRLLALETDKSRILVISLTDIGKIGQDIEQLGLKVHALNMNGALSFPIALFRLIQIFKATTPDVIQSWMYHADLLAGIAARICGIKNIVWGVRGTNPPIGNKQTFFIMKMCAFLSRVIPKKIIYVSQSALDSHVSYGYNKKKSVYVHNGIQLDSINFDIEGRALIRKKLGIPDTDTLVGTLGRFHADKGQDLLMNSIQQLLPNHPNVSFVFVGRGCDKLPEITGLGDKQDSKAPKIYFIGEQHNIQQWLSAFDIYCLPSRTEGFPNSLLEAMLLGLPCVATPAGDTVIIAADTVSVTADISSESITENLSAMLSLTSEQRIQLGKKASAHVKKYFSIEKAHENFAKVYAEIQ
ncbi:MAG: glycosyltransferase [Gammaproteobacteria bacterium]|nr:glycosyltransferase [Gammaproteobacteria bacterium]